MDKWTFYEQKFEAGDNLIGSWWGHVYFGYDLIANKRPKIVVELGTHYGISFFSFCQAVKDLQLDTELFAIDTWQGDDHAGRYDDSVYFSVVEKINKHYRNQNISLLRMLFDDAVDKFEDHSIDVLHIDGFHSYEAVLHDFTTWLPKVKRDGIIILHDINEHKDGFGVHRLWQELRERYETFEFYHWHGLGVVFVGSQDICKDNWLSHYTAKADRFIFDRFALFVSNLRKAHKEIRAMDKQYKIMVDEIIDMRHLDKRLDIALYNDACSKKELERCSAEKRKLQRTIKLMESSSFWKLRSYYMKIKEGLTLKKHEE